MPFELRKLLRVAHSQQFELYADHVNPQFTKVLRTIGFDRQYVKASGPYLWDAQGNQYLDMLAGYGVFNLGRNHPDIKAALQDYLAGDYPSLVQMDAPLLCGLLAKELKARIPYDLGKVFFTNSGTEGVEAAIKYARCATGRPGILYFNKAFHGLSNGSLSLNGDPCFRQGFGPLLPHCHELPFNDLAALEAALAQGDTAALIAEPIQGKGVNIPSPGFLAESARLCRQQGALFVADEVQTGMGRTGKFLAIEHEPGVEPDMVILAKGLSGGYVPVGALLCRNAIYNRVFSSLDRSVVHSSTFGGGAMAMVAGLATLACLTEHKLIERAAELGHALGKGLLAYKERFELIKEIRYRGLMLGIEFGPPKSLSLKSAWKFIHTLDRNLFAQAIVMPLLDDHRILTQVAGHNMDTVKLLPPLVINAHDVQRFLKAFERVMLDLHKFPGPVWEALSKIGKFALQNQTTRMAGP